MLLQLTQLAGIATCRSLHTNGTALKQAAGSRIVAEDGVTAASGPQLATKCAMHAAVETHISPTSHAWRLSSPPGPHEDAALQMAEAAAAQLGAAELALTLGALAFDSPSRSLEAKPEMR